MTYSHFLVFSKNFVVKTHSFAGEIGWSERKWLKFGRDWTEASRENTPNNKREVEHIVFVWFHL